MPVGPEISDAKRHGRHYTPTALADFLARRALAGAPAGGGELTVVDPACGDGELLLAAARAARGAGHTGPVELTGYEIDERAAAAATRRLRAAGLPGDIVAGDFLTHQRTMRSGTADLVITNPPYVRTQHLGRTTARLVADEFGLTGRVDLTHPFVAVAARLLRPGGTLALLCSNRFLTTLAGANIRRTLLAGPLRVDEIVDLGDTRMFRAAVLPAVIIARKTATAGRPARYVRAYRTRTGAADTAGTSLFEALEAPETGTALHNGRHYEVEVGTFAPPDDTATPWRLSDPASDEWLRSVDRRTWRTFGDVAKIRVGIKSTADHVFLGDDWGASAPEVEDDLLLPLLTQRDIAPWRASPNPGTKVLYPYDLRSEKRSVLDLDEWPGAKAYLLGHEERLRRRTYVLEGGRRWYEIWVPQRPALWAAPKIVFPDISERPRFALDTTGAVVNGNCYWISLRDIGNDDLAFLMLAVANSALGLRYYDEVCGNRLYSGKRRWITQYVNRLPLPDPRTPQAAQLIAAARALTTGGELDADRAGPLDRAVEAAFAASPCRADEPGHRSLRHRPPRHPSGREVLRK